MAKSNILTRSKKARANELFNANKLQEADALFAGICQSTPMDLEAWVMRAVIHRKLGLFKEAEAFCRHALKIKPDYGWGHQVLGTALQCQGDLAQAITCYRRAIQVQAALAEAHYLLANALRETGALTDAVASYRQAIRLQPDYVEALCNLGATLTALGDIQEATKLLNKAAKLRPDAPEVLCNLGHILNRDGQFAEALAKYQRAMELNPESLDAAINVAGLLEKTHRLDEAAQLINRILPRAPENPDLLVVAARLARRANRTDDVIALLHRALIQNPTPGTAGDIHFLLGQTYDKTGDAEHAFQHLAEANRLAALATGTDGDQSKYISRVERMRAYLVPELAALRQASLLGGNDPPPIFLLGFPRSGTTLLEQILDSHPALQTLEEKYTVSAMVAAFEEMAQGRQDALAHLTNEQILQLREIYFKEVARHLTLEPGNLIVDKMPLDTINAHVIWRVFPQAKFILALRHPCDVCLSCFMQKFVMNESNAGFVSLESAARVYSKVMQTWQDVVRLLPLEYHQIRYEDLVADFENETRALLDFLGVGWSDSVLGHTEHAIKRGTIRTPSYHQVTRPIYQDAKYRWRRYAKYFEQSMPVLQPYIDFFGYGE